MGLLSREQVLAAEDVKCRDVEVPEWGGTVRVRVMSGAQRDRYEQMVEDQRSGKKVDVRGLTVALVILTLVDEEGKPLFTLADLDAVNAKNAAVINRLFRVAQELNALSEEEIEGLAGN